MSDSSTESRRSVVSRREFLFKSAVASGAVIGTTFVPPSIRTIPVAKAFANATPLPSTGFSGPFTATIDLALIDPGTFTFEHDAAGNLTGIVRTGEVFAGPTPISSGLVSCDGNLCDGLDVSFVLVLQSADIDVVGPVSPTGDTAIAGTIAGTFTITALDPTTHDPIGALSGAYSGTLTGQLNLLTFALSGEDSGTWTLTSGTGIFAGATGSGTIEAQFEGDTTGESATVTLSGVID